MWDECNCAVVWAFFGIAFFGDWNENWPFPVLWPLLSFPNLLAYWVQHFHTIIFQDLKYLNWNSITSTSFVSNNCFLRPTWLQVLCLYLNWVVCFLEKTSTSWFQNFYKATVIWRLRHRHKDSSVDNWNRIETPEQNSCARGQVTFFNWSIIDVQCYTSYRCTA